MWRLFQKLFISVGFLFAIITSCGAQGNEDIFKPLFDNLRKNGGTSFGLEPDFSREFIGQTAEFGVGRIALGGAVISQDRESLRCIPSYIFPKFQTCQSANTQNPLNMQSKRMAHLLLSPEGTVVFVSREVTHGSHAAPFADRMLRNITRKLGKNPKIQRRNLPGGPSSMIAAWGELELLPLSSSESLRLTERGRTATLQLVDFLGDPIKSARQGAPVFILAGGPGQIFQTIEGRSGRKSRLIAADPSRYKIPEREPRSAETEIEATKKAGTPTISTAVADKPIELKTAEDGSGAAADVKISRNITSIPQSSATELQLPLAVWAKQFWNRIGGVNRALIVLIFLLPTILALTLGHPSAISVVALNILAGPILGLGWLVAMALLFRPNFFDKFKPSDRASVREFPPELVGLPIVRPDVRQFDVSSLGPQTRYRSDFPKPQYAKAECYDCHIRLPKPEMHQSYITTGGSSRTYYNSKGEQRGWSESSGRSKTIWRCDECEEAMIQRFWRNVRIAAIAFIIVLVILALSPTK